MVPIMVTSAVMSAAVMIHSTILAIPSIIHPGIIAAAIPAVSAVFVGQRRPAADKPDQQGGQPGEKERFVLFHGAFITHRRTVKEILRYMGFTFIKSSPDLAAGWRTCG
jgi:hypothetical protein